MWVQQYQVLWLLRVSDIFIVGEFNLTCKRMIILLYTFIALMSGGEQYFKSTDTWRYHLCMSYDMRMILAYQLKQSVSHLHSKTVQCIYTQCCQTYTEVVKPLPTHMLLYLIMEPTITATPPRSAMTELVKALTVTSLFWDWEICVHSSHIGRQMEFSR